MIVNFVVDENSRIQSITEYPVDMNEPTLELPVGFDLNTLGDYVYANGKLNYDPIIIPPTIDEQIAQLKQNLLDTDYVVIKIAEGAADVLDSFIELIKQGPTSFARVTNVQITELPIHHYRLFMIK